MFIRITYNKPKIIIRFNFKYEIESHYFLEVNDSLIK